MNYQEIFNNFSVPVSCCNTTSPLANETTCPEIVLDVNDFENEIAIFSEVEQSDYAYALKCMHVYNQTNNHIGRHHKKLLLIIIA